MFKLKNIAITVLLFVAVYFYNIYQAAKSLSFGIGAIRNLKFSKGAISFILNLRATNGDGVTIPLTGLNIDNYFGNAVIGKAILESSVFLSGRSVTDIPLSIYIPFTDLLYLIPEIKTTLTTKKVVLSLRGTVSAVGITTPVEQKYILDLNNII
jgi:LEA14-like dessication related protein